MLSQGPSVCWDLHLPPCSLAAFSPRSGNSHLTHGGTNCHKYISYDHESFSVISVANILQDLLGKPGMTCPVGEAFSHKPRNSCSALRTTRSENDHRLDVGHGLCRCIGSCMLGMFCYHVSYRRRVYHVIVPPLSFKADEFSQKDMTSTETSAVRRDVGFSTLP